MKHDFELSLVELAGQGIADIYGYVSTEFGDPSFKLTRVVMQDGRTISCEGEHDHPYLADYDNVVALPDEETEEG